MYITWTGNLRERVGTGLQSTAKHREESTKLDVKLAAEEVAGPHHEQGSHGPSSTEHSVGRRDDGCSNRRISGLAFSRQIEVGIPSWLTDGAGDNRSTVTVGLAGTTLLSNFPSRTIKPNTGKKTHEGTNGHKNRDQPVIGTRLRPESCHGETNNRTQRNPRILQEEEKMFKFDERKCSEKYVRVLCLFFLLTSYAK